LSKELNNYLKKELFDTTLIAIQADNLSKGKTLFKKNEKLLLHPASNMKLITSAAGLIFLGEDYNFSTKLFYDGEIINDTLCGNLIFVGGCDPDFTINDFYPFLNEIKNYGIKYVQGNLIGDISFKDEIYWGKGWMWDDDPSSDAPRLSAFNLNDNCVIFNVKNGKYEIEPKTNFVKVFHLTDSDEFIIDRNWMEGKNEIIIKGKTKTLSSTQINVVNPELYFLTVFREILDSNSIRISGQTELLNLNNDYDNLIYSFDRELKDVLTNLNKTSDNLSAEMVLFAMGEKYFGKPSTFEKGIKIIQMLIDSLKLKSSNYRIVDGSGVSHYNLVSVELIMRLLKYMYNQPENIFNTFLNSLPISGIDGTLKNRMKNEVTYSKVFAKTGTLSGVSCLSGYMKNQKGEMIAFSIFIQNFVGSSKQARDIQDDICKIIYLNN
jgi:D-alanyl-D-alanine carboxypeptidase/D-alanyl-D-alanine-endopeptidase (penicillin-binding protein 4)